jgi:ribosomal protein S18 acetylase RimI-like enzyme
MDASQNYVDSTPAEDPMAGVPELRSYVTEDQDEKIDALKLVADSVAQMRQLANSALIFHRLNMAIAVAVISLLARYLLEWKRDIVVTATTCSGLVMVCFALCRYATQGYLLAAESISWDWLGNADVLVTKFGDEVIGTVIIDWVSGESRQRRKKAWRGEIKGWAVRLKYRGKGVGSALLEEAVKESRKKGAETIEFAEDHASKLGNYLSFREADIRCLDSKRVLPKFYNGQMDKRETRARELLQDLLEQSPTKSRRKRGGSS